MIEQQPHLEIHMSQSESSELFLASAGMFKVLVEGKKLWGDKYPNDTEAITDQSKVVYVTRLAAMG